MATRKRVSWTLRQATWARRGE
ncbi:uncharacterized protein G2W53_001321 [Senna tora]|uniref:Uncharacterized protein n=1 Tax=Senna tora TaxID=362788 RepID=A0A834XIG1_9FABA|nr:uncharacterized protein G2W53_001321 [Senna tora]